VKRERERERERERREYEKNFKGGQIGEVESN
jgi:hypothetical protein